jgi:starvation-inducible DNA-binding protein
MFDTRNDIPADARARLIELLNARLADALDLAMQVKHAHWNVRGPQFIALHELFDTIAAAIEEHIDTIAERATALGGSAHGTVAAVARGTSLKPYPEELIEGLAHVEALAAVVADFGRKARAGIDQAVALADADTADLLTEVSRDTDKQLWLLEAHLHARR